MKKLYSLTIFKSAFDNKTHRRMDFDSWGDFVHLLNDLSTNPIESKKFAPLISPALYTEGTTRSNRNVTEWGHWACVDIDEGIGSVDEILDRFKHTRCVVYSTASCTPEKIKLRVVFDLDRRVQVSEIKHFWYALNKSIGDLGDAQTKDSSRMYYVPATYGGAFNFIHVIDGDEPLYVDALIREHPYQEKTGNSFLDALPDGVRESVLEHRKSSLTNTNVTWSGYRNCPFFPNKMADEYRTVNETGWYSGMYRIMVATACNAVKEGYPITASQIGSMCRELDAETGNWYENRPLDREAGGALTWAYANAYKGDF
jgi:hypothetical protein